MSKINLSKAIKDFQEKYKAFEKEMETEMQFTEIENGCNKIKEIIAEFSSFQEAGKNSVVHANELYEIYTKLVYALMETPIESINLMKNYSELTKKSEYLKSFNSIKKNKISENNEDFILLNTDIYTQTYNELNDYFILNWQEVSEDKLKELAIRNTREKKGVIKNDIKLTDTDVKAMVNDDIIVLEYIKIFSEKKYEEFSNIIYLGKRTLELIKNQLYGNVFKEGKSI